MRTRLLAVVAAALLFLGACSGGNGDGTGVASLGDRPAAADDASADAGDGKAKDPQEAAVEYARCMREHGVDMPDPEVDDNGRTRMRVQRVPGDGPDEDFEKAEEACDHLLADAAPQLSDEERKKRQDAMLAFARCMREHGIDMPDPEGDGRGRTIVRAEPGRRGGIDPESEEFQAADRECRKHLDAAGGGPEVQRSTL